MPTNLNPSDKPARDALLDELLTAVNEWADEETTRINDEAKFLTDTMAGRGGAAQAASANVEQGTVLAADTIAVFLRGS
jgi:hypothetical protein